MSKSFDISQWSTKQWVVTALVLLVLTLSPMAWTQWRQLQLLSDDRNQLAEQTMWESFELERDIHELGLQLRRLQTNPDNDDGVQLRKQFELLASRVTELEKHAITGALENSSAYPEAREAVRRFIQDEQSGFERTQQWINNPTELGRIADKVRALSPLMLEVSREANRQVARLDDERTEQLRQQSGLVIGMAVLHSLLMLLLLGVLLRHIRNQQQQYEELEQISQQLEKARDEAEAANQGKSVFLANMSHEVRTPFQGLLGMLTLLEQTTLDGQQRDYLQTAQDSAVHLLGVLNDILDVSTMESGTLKLSVTPINLRGVVNEVEDLMNVAAQDKGLQLSVYTAADLPEWVMADPTRVRQILFNLLSNAIKFTHQGSVIAEVTRNPTHKEEIVMTVRDTGVGMDPDTVTHLFTRFYQADSSLRRRTGGAGLGLEISRNLSRLMGGDIEVSSEIGVGSVFVARLCLPETSAPQDSRLQNVDGSKSRSTRKLRLLVAEDHPINLKYMSILLDKMGHDATFCENGQEVLELLKERKYDAVLLDYHMPVLDGLATTEAIRSLSTASAHIPVILVTADVVNDTRKRALDVGVNEFTSKPLQEQDLERALQRCGLLDDAPSVHGELAGNSPTSSPFPVSSYEMPQRLSENTMSDMSASLESLIDLASYEEILSLMPQEALDDLLKTLFDAPNGTVPELLSAFATGERKLIGDTAHKLKGTCMLLGFKAMATSSARIEHLALRSEESLDLALADVIRKDTELTQLALAQYKSQKAA
jgi:signal transduction histidine kinase/response regulator RpfG family c-di-GMP phosphodiesterase